MQTMNLAALDWSEIPSTLSRRAVLHNFGTKIPGLHMFCKKN